MGILRTTSYVLNMDSSCVNFVELKKTAVRGLGIVAGINVASAVASRFEAILLAILLIPDDFGIFRIAIIFIQMSGVFTDFGIGRELVQREKDFEKALHTGMTLRLIVAVVLFLVAILASPFVGMAYSEGNVTYVMMVLAMILLLNFFSFAPRVSLSRELKFARVTIPDSIGKIAKSIIVVSLAYFGFAFWSMVYGEIIGVILGIILLYWASPWKLKLRLDRDIMREIVGYGKYVTMASLVLFFFHSIDDILIGAVLGLATLGVYTVAYGWGVFFPSVMNKTIEKVMFPVYSKAKTSVERLSRSFLQSVKYIGYVSSIICFGLVALAPDFIHYVLGEEKWLEAIIPLQLLSIYGLHMSLTVPIETIYYSVGKPRENLLFAAEKLVLLAIPLLPVMYWMGLVGVSVVLLVVGLVMSFWMFRKICGFLDVSLSEVGANLAPSFASAIGTAVVLLLLKLVVPGSFLVFLLLVLVGVGIYIVFLVLSTRGRFIEDVRELWRLLVKPSASE